MDTRNKIKFYDFYHKKNKNYFAIIGDGNFTYYYHIHFLKMMLSGDIRNVSSVLDVGCGVGTLAFYVASKGKNVTAVDVSSRAIEICNDYKKDSKLKNINFINSDVTKLTAHKYDSAICTEVVEHIDNDMSFLRSINRSLNENGLLLLSTPSKYAPLYRMGFLDKFDREVGHVRRYSLEEIEKLLSETGFVVLEKKKTESLLRNLLFTIQPLGILIKFIRGPLVPFYHFLDEILVKLFGESDLIILAQKKI